MEKQVALELDCEKRRLRFRRRCSRFVLNFPLNMMFRRWTRVLFSTQTGPTDIPRKTPCSASFDAVRFTIKVHGFDYQL